MPGRNDLCPCGSGKKYKKCCLTKERDEEDLRIKDEHAQLAAAISNLRLKNELQSIPAPTPAPKSVQPPDPHMEALNARWQEFENADADSCHEVFVRTLDDPELMDDEMLFYMLERIRGIAFKTGQWDRFVGLTDLLKARLPDVYNQSRKHYLIWRIEIAIAGHQRERLREFTREITEIAGDDVDQYRQVVNLLAYHGELAALSEASHIAWPRIKTSPDILWGQSDYASWGADCAIFERLESSKEFAGPDAELIEQAKYYFEDLRVNEFNNYVDRLSGAAQRAWSIDDFDFKRISNKKRNEEKDPIRANVAHLLDDFVFYAHRDEGVAYTKAAMVTKNIYRYLMQRHDGDLAPQQSMYDAIMKPDKKPKQKPRQPDHSLCPDRETFERYLSSLMGLMVRDYYHMAATFELIPAWMRFLELRGLIESHQRDATLAEIGKLQPKLVEILESECEFLTLAENIRKWPENIRSPQSATSRQEPDNA